MVIVANDLFQELSELTSSPPAGIKVSLADESDLFKWKVTMEGPANSPYAVSHFSAVLEFLFKVASPPRDQNENYHLLPRCNFLSLKIWLSPYG